MYLLLLLISSILINSTINNQFSATPLPHSSSSPSRPSKGKCQNGCRSGHKVQKSNRRAGTHYAVLHPHYKIWTPCTKSVDRVTQKCEHGSHLSFDCWCLLDQCRFAKNIKANPNTEFLPEHMSQDAFQLEQLCNNGAIIDAKPIPPGKESDPPATGKIKTPP